MLDAGAHRGTCSVGVGLPVIDWSSLVGREVVVQLRSGVTASGVLGNVTPSHVLVRPNADTMRILAVREIKELAAVAGIQAHSTEPGHIPLPEDVSRELAELARARLPPLTPDDFPASDDPQLGAAATRLRSGDLVGGYDALAVVAARRDDGPTWMLLARLGEQLEAPERVWVALRRSFLCVPPRQLQPEWRVFLRLTISFEAYSGLADVLAIPALADASVEVLGRSLRLVFHHIGRSDVLEAMAHRVLANQPSALQLGGLKLAVQSLPLAARPELQAEDSRIQDLLDTAIADVVSVAPGYIASFGVQQFGFIQSSDMTTLFFRFDDVEDEELRRRLQTHAWRGIGVRFERRPSPGHPYERAVHVRLSSSALVQHAVSQTGGSLVVRAKEMASFDPEGALTLYRTAVEKGHRPEAAVNDLASLLHQRGRGQEALKELRVFLRRAPQARAVRNHFATLLAHLHRHQEALKELDLLKREASESERASLARREAYSLTRLGQLTQARQALFEALEKNPDDSQTRRLIQRIGVRPGAGGEDDVFDWDPDPDHGVSFGVIASAHLESAPLVGFDPEAVGAGTVTLDDARRVASEAAALPLHPYSADRARLFLSAASAVRRFQLADDLMVRVWLSSHFDALATFAEVAGHPPEVRQALLAEAIALAPPTSYAVRLFALYVLGPGGRVRLDNVLHDRPRGWRAAAALTAERCALEHGSWVPVFEALRDLALRTRIAEPVAESLSGQDDVGTALREYLHPRSAPGAKLYDLWQAVGDQDGRIRNELAEQLETALQWGARGAASDVLADVAAKVRSSPLDRERLMLATTVAVRAVGLHGNTADIDQIETESLDLVNVIDQLVRDIVARPTYLSYLAREPLIRLRLSIEQAVANRLEAASPTLRIEPCADTYWVDPLTEEIRLQLRAINTSTCSAGSVQLLVGHPDSDDSGRGEIIHGIAERLRSGGAVEFSVPLRAKSADGAIALSLHIRCLDRLGRRRIGSAQRHVLRVCTKEPFPAIRPNPCTMRLGPEMATSELIGRDPLVANLLGVLSSPSGAVLLHGQERSGKSSIASRVALELRNRGHQVVRATFHTLPNGLTKVGMARWISSLFPPQLPAPPASEAGLATEPLKSTVLIVDEFSELYARVSREVCSSDCFEPWVEFFERREGISVLLVGKDTLPRMSAEFAPAFAGFQLIRVPSLPDRDATDMIRGMIPDGRLTDAAIESVARLCGGSPYYTLLLLDRVIDNMNATRALVATTADVEAAIQHLILDRTRLSWHHVEHLFLGGDGVEDTGIDIDEARAVCLLVARGAAEGGARLEDVVRTGGRYREVLDDLIRREVIRLDGDRYLHCNELFRQWLLVNG